MLIFSVSFQFFRMSPRRGQYCRANEGGDAQDFAFCLSRGCPFPHKEGTQAENILKACSSLLEPSARKHITTKCATTEAHEKQNTARKCTGYPEMIQRVLKPPNKSCGPGG